MKFAEEIVKEIENRRTIEVPDGYVFCEEFERFLRGDKDVNSDKCRTGT